MFTDTNGVPVVSVNLALAELATSAVFVVRLHCASNTFLVADAHASARVLARRSGTADAFQNLAVAPINLNAYASTAVDFDVKVEALDVAGLVSSAITVRATGTP